MAHQVDVNELVVTESTNTQNGFEIEQRVLITTVQKWQLLFCSTHKPFIQLRALKLGALSTAFSLQGQTAMRCSGYHATGICWFSLTHELCG